MSKEITIRKGLDINLNGVADRVLRKAAMADTYALCPSHYQGVTPKLLVKVDDKVKVGTPLFFDKEHPEVLFTSPVSGTVKEIVRGEKRKILAVEVTADGQNQSETYNIPSLSSITRQQAKDLLLQTGLWTTLIQRPFGVIANTEDCPRDIFISTIDTAPLGVDLDFILQDQVDNLTSGLELLSKLTSGNVYLGISDSATSVAKITNVNTVVFKGKHPVGNVGTQISAIAPISKGEVVWTVAPQHVVAIGKLVKSGVLSFEKTVAVAGSQIKTPSYKKIISGAKVSSIIGGELIDDNNRIISGNPLSGSKVCQDGYIGFYDNSICVIKEGDHYEFIGWALPRLNKFSASRCYFSWLMPKRQYDLDTNLNGGQRAFVFNGIYEKVMPMDIYPAHLLKAIMANDIDKMENLGIYEVIEEDFALCEFICPSKIEWQSTLRSGINQLIKEL